MAYSDKVIDHFENPRNMGSLDKNDPAVGTGIVGAPECGDVMKLQLKINNDGIIEEAKWKTFGCGSAIASSSLVTEWVKGKTIDDAAVIKNSEIAMELSLPPVKIHCSVLAEDAIKAAIKDYREKMTRDDIQKVIDEDINPGLAMHGGFISIYDFDEENRDLKLTMGGGCQGCASSKVSMAFAVERHLTEVFPEIGEIEDVTDHIAGENPYYSREQ